MNNLAIANSNRFNLTNTISVKTILAVVVFSIVAFANVALNDQVFANLVISATGAAAILFVLKNLKNVFVASFTKTYEYFLQVIESNISISSIFPKPGILKEIKVTQEQRERNSEQLVLIPFFTFGGLYAVADFTSIQVASYVFAAIVVSLIVLTGGYLASLLIKNSIKVTAKLFILALAKMVVASSVFAKALCCAVAIAVSLLVTLATVAYFAGLGLTVKFGGESAYTIINILFAAKAVVFLLYNLLSKDSKAHDNAVSTAHIVQQMVKVEVQDKSETIFNKVTTKSTGKQKFTQNNRHTLKTIDLSLYGAYAQKANKGLGLSSFKENWILHKPIDDNLRGLSLA
jgi:hypothetical protein